MDDSGLFIPSSADGTNYIRIEHETAGRHRIAGALMDESCVPLPYRDLQFSDLTTWNQGSRNHDGFLNLVSQLERMATPAFVHRMIASAESERDKAEHAIKAARTRADAVQAELSKTVEKAAHEAEAFSAEKRSWEALKRGWESEKTGLLADIKKLERKVEIADKDLDEVKRMNSELQTERWSLKEKLSEVREQTFVEVARNSVSTPEPDKRATYFEFGKPQNKSSQEKSNVGGYLFWGVLLCLLFFIAAVN